MAEPESIAVLGLGLMGGSLALALREAGYAGRIPAWARREDTRRQAEALGVFDVVCAEPTEAVAGAAVVVVCTPVATIPELVGRCAGQVSADGLVTDVGSTKAWLEREVPRVLGTGGARFVGSHPMCGSEQTGLEAARADLYRGATVVCTRAEPVLEALWSLVGGRVIVLEPERHDALVARTSHLPHLAAAILVQSVADGGDPELARMISTGFRDTTRVAAGSPDMWRDILATNDGEILAALQNFRAQVDQWIDLVERGAYAELRHELEQARRLRGELFSS